MRQLLHDCLHNMRTKNVVNCLILRSVLNKHIKDWEVILDDSSIATFMRRYEAQVPSAFCDHIPIIQKMIDSFEVLIKNGISDSETF